VLFRSSAVWKRTRHGWCSELPLCIAEQVTLRLRLHR